MESSLVFLTIVLSIFLALFLLLGIILLVKCIQIANRAREVIETTHRVMGKVDGVADALKKASGSIAVGKLVSRAFEHFSSKHTKSKDKEEE